MTLVTVGAGLAERRTEGRPDFGRIEKPESRPS